MIYTTFEACSNCFKKPNDLGREDKFSGCSACNITKYCSRECQVSHWHNVQLVLQMCSLKRNYCRTGSKTTG